MEREAYFDNARLLLIFLVVFGHMLQPFTDNSRELDALYMWIYTFHMPAFIFLAGYFAKGSGNLDYIMNLAKKLLVPYLIFQFIYSAYYFFIGKNGWQTGIFYPHWSLWFLFSLFSWHLLLIWFKKFPALLGVSLSIIIGLLIGYYGNIGHTFSLSRTFVLFPFFLLGFWTTKRQVMFLKRREVKIAAVFAMVSIAIAIYIAPNFNSGWLLGSKSYDALGLPEYGGVARLFVYVTSFIMAMSILAWVSTKKNFMTHLGTRTLYVYLLHGFFIQFFREANLFNVQNIVDLIGIAILSAVIVIVLSSKPVLGIWQPFIEGKMSIIKDALNLEEENEEHEQKS